VAWPTDVPLLAGHATTPVPEPGERAMNHSHRLLATAALSLLAATASAKIIVSDNHPSNFSYTVSGTWVPITSTGATSVSFNVKKAGKYVLTFSAECAVDAPAGNNVGWVEIDLFVNHNVVAPTVGTADSFCSANGTAGFDGYVRPSITTVVDLVAGPNALLVYGKFQAGATGGWISDSAFVIHQ
jgi:hypothetical protein